MVEINDFKNFEQFMVYINQNHEKMQYWSTKETKLFTDKVAKLIDESPEFKEKYDAWAKKLELQAKAKEARIKIGGTVEETASSKAYLRLKEIQKEKQKRKENSPKTSQTANQLSRDRAIEI